MISRASAVGQCPYLWPSSRREEVKPGGCFSRSTVAGCGRRRDDVEGGQVEDCLSGRMGGWSALVKVKV